MSYTEKRHDRGIIRKNTYKHIQRKVNILKNVYDGGVKLEASGSYYGYTHGDRHRLSKKKIHCSCPMCTEKTKNIGYSHSDKVKLSKASYDFNQL